jgi:aminoglycoside phosphotransferase (APT) family kinase protein
MSLQQVTFADANLARKALTEMYPQAKQITLIEHGYDNIVGLIDGLYAVRFPRNSNAYKRSQYEKEILRNLSELKSISLPHIIDERDTPPCLVTTFVHGVHLSPIDVNGFTPEQQEDFGKSVGRFAFELHSLLSVDEAREFRKKLGLDELEEEPWPIYMEKRLVKTKFPTNKQDELAKQYFELWKQHDTEEGLVVVHDDLHTENMLFEKGRLSGVLDFGDTNIGTPEQELRQLYRINEKVLRSAIAEYSAHSGLQLNVDAAINWAIAQELAAYSERLTTNNTKHPAFARACHNLNKWLPEGRWGQGFEIAHRDSTLQ